MFAIALWDRQQQTLTLARDRFGEKPLYYGFAGGGRGPLLFGSELKSLMAHPHWQGTLATDVLEDYLRFGCVGGAVGSPEGALSRGGTERRAYLSRWMRSCVVGSGS